MKEKLLEEVSARKQLFRFNLQLRLQFLDNFSPMKDSSLFEALGRDKVLRLLQYLPKERKIESLSKAFDLGHDLIEACQVGQNLVLKQLEQREGNPEYLSRVSRKEKVPNIVL